MAAIFAASTAASTAHAEICGHRENPLDIITLSSARVVDADRLPTDANATDTVSPKTAGVLQASAETAAAVNCQATGPNPSNTEDAAPLSATAEAQAHFLLAAYPSLPPTDANQGQPPTPPPPTGIGPASGALDELDQALDERQIFADLNTLHDRILDLQRPVANAEGKFSTQSDGLDIRQLEASQDIYFAEGTDRIRLGFQNFEYTPKTGGALSQFALGSEGGYRFNDDIAITGDIWANEINPPQQSAETIATYDLFVTVWPNDYIRADIDSNRSTFDNIKSLADGIVSDSIGGSVDYMPFDGTKLTLRARDGFYSDGNSEQSGEIEAAWRLKRSPSIAFGLLLTSFQFQKLLNNGYFNPKQYESASALLRLETSPIDALNIEFAFAGGAENADPGGLKPLVKASMQLTYKIGEDWSVDGGVAYFSSRAANASGFRRTSISIGLHRKSW